MNKKFILGLLLLVAFSISLHSCRNDLLNEQHNTLNPNASKFRMVKLKDIPNVENFIYKESGRKDMKVPLNSISVSGKQDLTIGNIETTAIVEADYGNDVYYVFKVENMNATDAVYNLEVKKTNGEVVRAEIIEYDPKDGTSLDFQHFTGSVTSYSLQGKTGSTIGFNDGSSDCPPPSTGTPGGNQNPGDIPPPNGGWYGDGGGPKDTTPWSDYPTDCTNLVLDGHGNTLGWYNTCTGEYYPNANKMSSTGETINALSADCNGDGSGVIITNPPNPCEKIVTENNKAKIYLGRPLAAARKVEITTGIATAPQEKGFSFGYDSAGAEKVTLVKVGTNGGSVNIVALGNAFTIIGGVHTHMNDGFYVSSVGDIYTFEQANELNPKFQYYYTLAPNGDEYVFTITDLTAFNDFINNHSADQYIDDNADWITTTDIGIDANNVYTYFNIILGKSDDESKELSQAFVIGKYGMGIGLSKKDTSGNFQPIFVKELPDPNDPTKKIYEKTEDCNL